jgi:hypothetical protein
MEEIDVSLLVSLVHKCRDIVNYYDYDIMYNMTLKDEIDYNNLLKLIDMGLNVRTLCQAKMMPLNTYSREVLRNIAVGVSVDIYKKNNLENVQKLFETGNDDRGDYLIAWKAVGIKDRNMSEFKTLYDSETVYYPKASYCTFADFDINRTDSYGLAGWSNYAAYNYGYDRVGIGGTFAVVPVKIYIEDCIIFPFYQSYQNDGFKVRSCCIEFMDQETTKNHSYVINVNEYRTETLRGKVTMEQMKEYSKVMASKVDPKEPVKTELNCNDSVNESDEESDDEEIVDYSKLNIGSGSPVTAPVTALNPTTDIYSLSFTDAEEGADASADSPTPIAPVVPSTPTQPVPTIVTTVTPSPAIAMAAEKGDAKIVINNDYDSDKSINPAYGSTSDLVIIGSAAPTYLPSVDDESNKDTNGNDVKIVMASVEDEINDEPDEPEPESEPKKSGGCSVM